MCARGGGWIERRGNTWWVRWRDHGVKRAAPCASEDEAEAVLLRVRQAKRAGQYLPPNEVTVTAWIEECCDRWADRLTVRTIRNYRERSRTMIAARIGRRQVVDLTGLNVQRWIDGLKRDGFAPSTIASAVAVLSGALRDAVVMGMVPRNVCQGVRRPGVVPPDVPVWSATDVRHVMRMVAGDPIWHALYMVAVGTGMRPGELRALAWRDVFLDRGVIRVARTITRDAAGHEVIGTQTKTHKVRVVAIGPGLVRVLR